MGLWSVQLTCFAASQWPVMHENKMRLYVEAERLRARVPFKVKGNNWQTVQGRAGKAESCRNITFDLTEARRAWTCLAVCGSKSWGEQRKLKLSHTTDCTYVLNPSPPGSGFPLLPVLIFFIPFSSPAIPVSVCFQRGGERPTDQNEALRPALRLHTLRCDTASQMLWQGRLCNTHGHIQLTGAAKCSSGITSHYMSLYDYSCGIHDGSCHNKQ